MSELGKLYQNVILDHNKNPRNFRMPEGSNRKAEGYNPVCGDQIIVYAKLEQNRIYDIGFQGTGCAISKASASMMTDNVNGKSLVQVQEIYENVQKMLSDPVEKAVDLPVDLKALSGVRQFPIRIKCALLPWQTLFAALEDKSETVTTE